MSLVQVADGLWTAEGRVRWLGQQVPTRMTAVRLADGGLWIHSPIALDAGCGVDALGRVAHLVAPSTYHHLWLGDWARAFPDAKVHGAPGLAEKRTDLAFDGVLGDEAPADWSGVFDQLVFGGLPIFNEVVFCHRPSRTLIATDLVFHIHEADGLLAPLVMRANGMWKRFGPSRALGVMLRRNRDAARASLETIQRWDYDRVLPAHGRVLETGGHAAMQQAFAFLLER